MISTIVQWFYRWAMTPSRYDDDDRDDYNCEDEYGDASK